MPDWVLQDRYRPHHVIGRGALAEVWRATDLLLGCEVAVKLFLPRPAGPGAATVGDQSVEGEISALTQLSHPNIVPLYDVGDFQGEPFVVMPLIEGPSLDQHLAVHGRLPLRHVATIGAGLASALACVHQHGIVHRDVKPANILITDDGTPLLADFGVALPVTAEPATATGHTVGTAFYMAPEQVRGERTGPAADVYALGLVLLECLTGHREYEGRPLDAAVARLSRPPVLPDELPNEWRGLLEGMLSLEPAQRPNAETVAERCAVRAAAADAAEEAAPAGFLDTLFPASEPASAAAPMRPSSRKVVAPERARHRTRGSRRRPHRHGAAVVAAAAAVTVVAGTFGVLRPGSTSAPAVDSVFKPPPPTAEPISDAANDVWAGGQSPDTAASAASAPTQAAPAPTVEPPSAAPPSEQVAEEPAPAAAEPQQVAVPATDDQEDFTTHKVKIKEKPAYPGNGRKVGQQSGAGNPGKGLGKHKVKN